MQPQTTLVPHSVYNCTAQFTVVPLGEVHPKRTMGLQQTSQLLWRNSAVVRSLALSFIGDAGNPVPKCGFTSVRLVPVTLCQRYPHIGEAGSEEMGF